MSNNLLKESKKISLFAIVATLSTALFFAPIISPVLAAANLKSGPNCQIIGTSATGFQLRCTANVSGLGGATSVTASVSAQATLLSGCTNRGDNNPPGLQRTTTPVFGQATFSVDKGGRANIDVTTQPPSVPQPKKSPCPDDQVTFSCITFSQIVMRVTPNSGQTAEFPYTANGGIVTNCPASVSRA